MKMIPVVEIKDSWKRYSAWRGGAMRLLGPSLEPMARRLRWRRLQGWLGQHKRTDEALRGVSFTLERGSCVGIIGVNGAGKSTLLQILAGTLKPSAGSFQVRGRVAALLELGSGFHPEFTGRENVYLNAQVLGLTRAQVQERFAAIEAFAGIGDFIDQPVRTYSSGMLVRLAFAVVAHVEADVLIVDEALAVGDVGFVQKCMRFLRNFREKGTLIFVTHDVGAVQSLCDRVIWLHRGRIERDGDPKAVTEAYLSRVLGEREGGEEGEQETALEQLRPGQTFSFNGQGVPVDDLRLESLAPEASRFQMQILPNFEASESFGENRARISEVVLRDRSGKRLSWVRGGEQVSLSVVAQANEPFASPILGFYIKNRLGQNLFGDNSSALTRRRLVTLREGEAF
ncbi:MAG: ABC transporter ATP-binding protein, partial [Verrucomicrobiota bacterium]